MRRLVDNPIYYQRDFTKGALVRSLKKKHLRGLSQNSPLVNQVGPPIVAEPSFTNSILGAFSDIFSGAASEVGAKVPGLIGKALDHRPQSQNLPASSSASSVRSTVGAFEKSPWTIPLLLGAGAGVLYLIFSRR